MKSHEPARHNEPATRHNEPASKDNEFFHKSHVDPSHAPPPPTTEREIAAREAALNSPAHVTRIDPASIAGTVPVPGTVPGAFPGTVPGALPGTYPAQGVVPPVPPMVARGPGGKEIEERNGVKYIKGTDIVVGGPTQQ